MNITNENKKQKAIELMNKLDIYKPYIMDEDIICPIGMEDQKLLLFDDFNCWDEGCLMGQVSPDVIAQMRTVS